MVTTITLQQSTNSCSELSAEKNKQTEKFVPIEMKANVVDFLMEKEQTFNQINKMVEEQQEEQTDIYTPNDSDVLGGRGSAVRLFPGNHNFLKIVKQYQPLYFSATTTKKKKGEIVMDIMEKIKSSGGRFLKLDNVNNDCGEWVCMNLDESRKKIGQALRDNAPITLKEQSKSKREWNKDESIPSPNQSKPVEDSGTKSMTFQDEINSKMMNNFKKEINRIRGDMNKLKRKYDELDREQLELTATFMQKIVTGGLHENEKIVLD